MTFATPLGAHCQGRPSRRYSIVSFLGSVTVTLKTMAGEVQHDENQHQHPDHGEEDLDS